MPVTVSANLLSVVHKDSSGISMAFPDVCKTPMAPSPVPLPYPNFAVSVDADKGAKKVKADGNPLLVEDSCFSKSTGDEPGSLGGVVSGTIQGKADFLTSSFDVQAEGKKVVRAFDLMIHNKGNTALFPLMQKPAVTVPGMDKPTCLICGKPL